MTGLAGMSGVDGMWTDLLGDAEIAAKLSDEAVLGNYRRFEMALIEAKRTHDIGTDAAAAEALAKLKGFQPDIPLLAEQTGRDGVTIPGFIRQLRGGLGAEAAEIVHSGATSQDVMDTATILCLREVNGILNHRLERVVASLANLEERFGSNRITGRTRMQAALSMAASERIQSWQRPLAGLARDRGEWEQKIYWLQFGGPVGDRRGFEGKGQAIAASLANRLELLDPGHSWHNDRRPVISQAEMLSRLTGALGKFGQDIALMAQNGIDEVGLSGGGGSSAMAHKTNPVAAEVLVALARYNGGQLSLLHNALIHEQERSGAAWTLEWLVLPGMCLAAGRSLLLADALVAQIEWIGTGV